MFQKSPHLVLSLSLQLASLTLRLSPCVLFYKHLIEQYEESFFLSAKRMCENVDNSASDVNGIDLSESMVCLGFLSRKSQIPYTLY